MYIDNSAYQLEKESRDIVARLDGYIVRNYGVRCDEYEPECVVCKIWKMRDDLKNHID